MFRGSVRGRRRKVTPPAQMFMHSIACLILTNSLLNSSEHRANVEIAISLFQLKPAEEILTHEA